jgi:hypothetical protein
MQRFKAFSSATWANDLARFEDGINEWIASERPHIHYMAQSPFGEHLVVSFIYASDHTQEAVAAAEAAVHDVFERTLENADLDPGDVSEVPLPLVELPY